MYEYHVKFIHSTYRYDKEIFLAKDALRAI